jgi:hypothetical protein
MSNAEWITDRLPTEADGDRDGVVWMRHSSGSEYNFFAHWSHVGPDAPWQRTIYWKPPAEPDRIAALEQRVVRHLRDQDELIAAMAKRLESLEQLFWAHKHEAQPVSVPAEARP